ncbi:MAG: class I adenylate-forming enzyme family protein [Myxococcota bacterium]
MLVNALDEYADAPLLVLGTEGTVTRGEVRDRALRIVARHGVAFSGRSLGIRGRPTYDNVAWLAASLQLGARAVVLPAEGAVDASTLELAGIVGEGLTEPSTRADVPDPGLVLFTSGTTGTPKAVRYDWADLVAGVHRGPSVQGARWLLTYPMSSFAGLQVLLHAILGRGAICVPAPGDPHRQLLAAAAAGVTHVSGTPTFFRLALTMGRLGPGWSPRQITLGGEPVDQRILDMLAARFPRARLTHIYASTELGPCFSVHDGRAGFPMSFLEREDLPVWLTVRDDELFVRSGAAFVATGDGVRVEGDRVFFTGRRGARLSVDGSKVDPAYVEHVLLSVPGVAAVRVSGEPSTLVGQLVKAEVVPAPGTEAHALRAAVIAHGRAHLDRTQRPRVVRIVDHLEQTPSGKIARPLEPA